MKAQAVIRSARRLLSDDNEGQERWDNDALLTYLSDAQRRLLMARPDLRLLVDGTVADPVEVDDMEDDLLVGEDWREALAAGVAAAALDEDDFDGNARKAVYFRQLFERHLGGGGR